VLRGMSYASVGRYRLALISLARARQLDPRNQWARDELWALHRQMDFDEIAHNDSIFEFSEICQIVHNTINGDRVACNDFHNTENFILTVNSVIIIAIGGGVDVTIVVRWIVVSWRR
jgi:hypothetical protein